jgi:hypothetical protein
MTTQDPEGERAATTNAPEGERLATTSAPTYTYRLSWTALAVLAVMVAIVVGGVATYVGLIHLPVESARVGTETKSEKPATEDEFISNFSNRNASDPVSSEWRAVRGDHKIIAYAIASCKQFRQKYGNFDIMPRHLFSLLLLDLTPLGGHDFSPGTVASDQSSTVKAEANQVDLTSNIPSGTTENLPELTHYQQSMLLMSDAIARARLEAARQADSTTYKAMAFGWFTVALSGLATLFITIKASMSVPKAGEYDWKFLTIGYFAMAISALVTVLSSAKQFYDPQRTYKSSEAALLELRRLQNQVSFEFIRTWDDSKCSIENNDFDTLLRAWSQRLANIEAVIVEASADLQDADLLKPEDLDKADNLLKQDQPKRAEQAAASPPAAASLK